MYGTESRKKNGWLPFAIVGTIMVGLLIAIICVLAGGKTADKKSLAKGYRDYEDIPRAQMEAIMSGNCAEEFQELYSTEVFDAYARENYYMNHDEMVIITDLYGKKTTEEILFDTTVKKAEILSEKSLDEQELQQEYNDMGIDLEISQAKELEIYTVLVQGEGRDVEHRSGTRKMIVCEIDGRWYLYGDPLEIFMSGERMVKVDP